MWEKKKFCCLSQLVCCFGILSTVIQYPPYQLVLSALPSTYIPTLTIFSIKLMPRATCPLEVNESLPTSLFTSILDPKTQWLESYFKNANIVLLCFSSYSLASHPIWNECKHPTSTYNVLKDLASVQLLDFIFYNPGLCSHLPSCC